MKITRLAVPGKCGALGASGDVSAASRLFNTAGNRPDPSNRERTIWRRLKSQDIIHSPAPKGRLEVSPRREPWETTSTEKQPRKGLVRAGCAFPRLAPWANFCAPLRG